MHHSRRKSGHGSSTDVRKAVVDSSSSSRHKSSSRSTMARKATPQTAHKLAKSPRSRDRDYQEQHWWEEERESFPQYCMSCEKQFVPQDDRFLYCSEACRVHDQNHHSADMSSSSAAAAARSYVSPSSATSPPSASLYPYYSSANAESRDIIPRASPSRPNSMHYSPPATPSQAGGGGGHHSSAILALRSLSIRDSSPPSPGGLMGTYHPNIWPFTSTGTGTGGGSSSARGHSTASPSTSYSRPASTVFSSTYDGAYYGATAVAPYGGGAPTLERPHPPLRRAGTYSRPKSIELVTPMVGR
ncbi:hypothetical protein RB597_008409 [Gaeumannomyces tritici]